MRKLTAIGAYVVFAPLFCGCSEQTRSKVTDLKITDAAKDVTAQAKGQIEKVGKAAQEVGSGVTNSVQEAGAKASKSAAQAVDDAGKAAENVGKAGDQLKARISAAAVKASDALGEQFSKAAEAASSRLNDVKGGPELVQRLRDVFPNLQKTLATISDKGSAEKAMPKLDELEGTITKLSGQFDQLPENAKKSIGDLIQKGAGSLQPLVDAIRALPAVEAIRPKLEAIMQKLKDLRG
jgi:DNA repair exonuclease SbcCD ATPase subunit